MFYLEQYLRGHYRSPICVQSFKTYKGAKKHIEKWGFKAQRSDYVIRDENNTILCNAHYEEAEKCVLFTEMDNIGRIENQFKVFERA